MRAVIVISLLFAVVAAGNSNSNSNNKNNGQINRDLSDRDFKRQLFIVDLLRHLQQDVHNNEFIQYSQTIRLDNKNDYKVSFD